MKFLKITLILSFICMASISAALITPALPMMGRYFHISQNATGAIVSVFLVGYVIGQLLYGPLANKTGINCALQVGILIAMVGIIISLVGSYQMSFMVCVLGRLVCALGAASGLACTFMILHDQYSDNEVKHISGFSIIAFTFGIGLAVFLGGTVTQYLGWLACFWVLLIYLAVMLLLTFFLPTCKKCETTESLMTNIKGLATYLKNYQIILFGCVVGLCSAVGYMYSAAAPIIAHNILHLSVMDYGRWNCINMVGMLIGGLSAAVLLKRISAKRLIGLSIALLLLCLLILLMLNINHLLTVKYFFITTCVLYLVSSWLFPSGAYLAMQNIKDKKFGASAKSFINMGSATLAVFIMNALPMSRLDAFIIVLLIFMVIVITGLILRHR